MSNEQIQHQIRHLEARKESFEWSLSEGRISAHTAENAIAALNTKIAILER